MHQLVLNVSRLDKLVHFTKEQQILFVEVIEIFVRQLQLHLQQLQLVLLNHVLISQERQVRRLMLFVKHMILHVQQIMMQVHV
jgi:hypothetical protein